jgi:hypothetical protein
MKGFIKFLMKFLNDKAVQSLLIETAETLAKKTANKTDDEVVAWFRKIWENK